LTGVRQKRLPRFGETKPKKKDGSRWNGHCMSNRAQRQEFALKNVPLAWISLCRGFHNELNSSIARNCVMNKSLGIASMIVVLGMSPLVWAQKGGGGGGNQGRAQGQGSGRGNTENRNQGQGNQGGRGQDFRGSTAPRIEGNARVQVGPGAFSTSGPFNRPGGQSIYRNEIQIGQRPYQIAPNDYRPSFKNYAWHNGYWNNSYGWNPQIVYGRSYRVPGYGYGNYGGYGIRLGNVSIGVGGNRGWDGYGNYGGYGYGRYPIGWGYSGWGLGNTLYRSGYRSYYNPYWIDNGGASYAYDYAQPIYVTGSTSAEVEGNSTNALVDAAVADFKAGKFESALTQLDQAIKANPNDGVLHELRALALFATKNYGEAAATIHSVLAVGPGWDWPTMSSLYTHVEEYTAQLRALETFTKEHVEDAGAQFLLGYHYMTLGYPENAAREFEAVVKLQPKDRVAQDLLNLVEKPKQGEPEPTPKSGEPITEADAKEETPPPIMGDKLSGDWTASREDGAKFKLDLHADKSFTWQFNQGTRREEFSGTYSTEGSLLLLQRKDGGAMVGHIAPDGEGQFTFKLVGGPQDDPGLVFRR
jgi:tetratricopeptide (TPR) repeat protein